MIVEEEDVAASKSVTDTSQMVESKGAETSERDFIRDMEREEMKRRTYQIQSPQKGVSFQEAIASDSHSEESGGRVHSNEEKQRPRID